MKTTPSEAQVLQQLLQGGFEHGRVLESDDAFANDAVTVQENRAGDALDAEALLRFGRAHEQRVRLHFQMARRPTPRLHS